MASVPEPARRLFPEPEPKNRTEFERDRDRVLYSSAFARLAGITQVATTPPGQGFHNRLTHTLKVGQLSSRMAKALGERYGDLEDVAVVSADAAEAAALGHDLGHPPFGHLGESTLNELAMDYYEDGFEANAQSFRVVNRISRRSIAFAGLNLTRLVLQGILKYPWLRSPNAESDQLAYRKWGAYPSEADHLRHALAIPPEAPVPFSSEHRQPSLIAQIIDWADDVTYAIHDLEDFYKAGLIPVHELVARPDERESFRQSFYDFEGNLRPKFVGLNGDLIDKAVENSLKPIFAMGLTRPYDGALDLRALVRYVSSYLIGQYFDAVEVEAAPGSSVRLTMSDEVRAEIAVLKELLWFYVIDRPDFAVMQHGQRRMLRNLVEQLIEISGETREWRVFPTPVRTALQELDDPTDANRARVIIDFIAGMDELQVARMSHTLAGGDISLLGM